MIVSIGVVRAFEPSLAVLEATSTASTFVAFAASSSSFVGVASTEVTFVEQRRPCSDCSRRPPTAEELA